MPAKRQDLLIIVLLLGLVIIFFREIIFSGRMVFGTDIILEHYIRTKFVAEQMGENHSLPLWNPNLMCGLPLLGNMLIPYLYPLNWLFLIIPVGLAIGYTMVLHIFLAGVFTYLFIRTISMDRFSALVGALSFMFTGWLISLFYPGQHEKIFGASLIPLAFLFLEKALQRKSMLYFMLTAVAVAMQMLCGHMQIMFYSTFALTLYFAYRCILIYYDEKSSRLILKLAGKFILTLVVVVLLASIKLLPALEYAHFSVRSGGGSYVFATSWSLPPEELPGIFIQNPFGWGVNLKQWSDRMWSHGLYYWGRMGSPWGRAQRLTSEYVGVLPIILTLLAIKFRRNRYTLFFAGLSILSLLIAMGRYAPLFKFFYRFIPGFGYFRVPLRMFVISCFSLSVLTAAGTQFLFGQIAVPERRRLWSLTKTLLIISIVLVGVVASGYIFKEQIVQRISFDTRTTRFWADYPNLIRFDQTSEVIYAHLLKVTFLFACLLFAGSLLLLLRAKEKLNPGILKWLLVIFLLGDLWSLGREFVHTVPPSLHDRLYVEDELVRFLKGDKGLYRVHSVKTGLEYEAQRLMLYGIQSITGWHPSPLKYYLDIKQGVARFPINLNLLDMLNVKYVLSSINLDHPRLRLAAQSERVRVYENRNFLPRAFIVHQVKVIKNREEILKELTSPQFNPRKYLILEEAPLVESSPSMLGAGSDEVKIIKYSPNQVIIKARLERPGFLVLSDTYYPAWSVYIDGKRDKIYKADHLLRAVYLKEGEHEIRFIYRPFSFRAGMALSSMGLCSVLLVGAAYLKRRRR